MCCYVTVLCLPTGNLLSNCSLNCTWTQAYTSPLDNYPQRQSSIHTCSMKVVSYLSTLICDLLTCILYHSYILCSPDHNRSLLLIANGPCILEACRGRMKKIVWNILQIQSHVLSWLLKLIKLEQHFIGQ